MDANKKILLEKLHQTIYNISEDNFSSNWCGHVEFQVWHDINTQKSKYLKYYEGTIKDLKKLTRHISGWIRWSLSQGKPIFVPKDEWIGLYKSWCVLEHRLQELIHKKCNPKEQKEIHSIHKKLEELVK